MRASWRLLGCCCLWFLAFGSAGAQELETTTEFGVTITPSDITDAVSETQDFWTPVLKYIGSDQFDVAESAIRKQTTEFFNRLHESLYKQLFEGDEEQARDLLDYFCLRLRKIALYRKIRVAVKDDATTVALMEQWEKTFREIQLLPAADRQARVEAMVKLMPDEMAARGVSAEGSSQAQQQWTLLGECMSKMYRTKAGALISKFEVEARQLERPVGELLRKVVTAGDWALITKAGSASAKRADFERSWKELDQFRQKHQTTARTVETR
jgi:hypothetical protein